MALYGAEVTAVPTAPFRRLVTACKRVLCPGTSSVAPPELVMIASGPKAPDPHWHVIKVRVRMFRVCWARDQGIREV
eukprot:11977243-Alexandrium_andersonii.AAC.1